MDSPIIGGCRGAEKVQKLSETPELRLTQSNVTRWTSVFHYMLKRCCGFI